MKQDGDLLLFEKVKKGDIVSYEIIFRKYYKELYRFAFSYVRESVMAEEKAQEVFLFLWEKRKYIDIQTTLKTYLYSAIKNKCLNYLKLELPRQRSMADVSEVMLGVHDPHNNNHTNEKLKRYIQKAVDVLPKKCRRIFILSRYSGLTYKEIAEELNLSKKTVENQMGIALRKLRSSLEPVYKRYKENEF